VWSQGARVYHACDYFAVTPAMRMQMYDKYGKFQVPLMEVRVCQQISFARPNTPILCFKAFTTSWLPISRLRKYKTMLCCSKELTSSLRCFKT
jgi:hypothetical protein